MMPESKFTKGPWVAEHAQAFGNTYRIRAGSLVLCAVVSRELVGNEFDLEEARANAELMADAPALLKVLRKVLEYSDFNPYWDGIDQAEAERAFTEADGLLEKHGG
jgi:hypothetical protein